MMDSLAHSICTVFAIAAVAAKHKAANYDVYIYIYRIGETQCDEESLNLNYPNYQLVIIGFDKLGHIASLRSDTFRDNIQGVNSVTVSRAVNCPIFAPY